jgi:hypothetical protein
VGEKVRNASIPDIARYLLASPKSAFFPVRCPIGIMNEVCLFSGTDTQSVLLVVEVHLQQ